jgi:hypothetical protein
MGMDAMGRPSEGRGFRSPESLRRQTLEIFRLTDAFCARHLDAEYAELCRKLVAGLARKRSSPLLRGDLRIWAGATIHVVGSLNFLFDRTQRPHLTVHQLSVLTGIPTSTLANKARLIRDVLRIGVFEPALFRREILESHPMAWMISVNIAASGL